MPVIYSLKIQVSILVIHNEQNKLRKEAGSESHLVWVGIGSYHRISKEVCL